MVVNAQIDIKILPAIALFEKSDFLFFINKNLPLILHLYYDSMHYTLEKKSQ